MPCPTKERLQQRYNRVSVILDDARKRLLEGTTTRSETEFLELSDEVNRARDVLRHIRLSLDWHIRQHCCLMQEDTAAMQ
jgi:hypothetical protein